MKHYSLTNELLKPTLEFKKLLKLEIERVSTLSEFGKCMGYSHPYQSAYLFFKRKTYIDNKTLNKVINALTKIHGDVNYLTKEI